MLIKHVIKKEEKQKENEGTVFTNITKEEKKRRSNCDIKNMSPNKNKTRRRLSNCVSLKKKRN